MNELMNDVDFCQWRHAAIDYASHNNYFDDLIYVFRQCTLNSPSICKNAPRSTIVVGSTAVHPNKRRLIVSPTQTRVLMRSTSSSTTSTTNRRLALRPKQRLRCDDVLTRPAACQRSSTTLSLRHAAATTVPHRLPTYMSADRTTDA